MKKRLFIAIAALGMFAGCTHEESSKPTASSSAPKPAVADTSKPASAVKPPSAKEYYEVNKNGKTYVFGKLDSVLAFRKSGALPAETVEKPGYGPAGETVVFETGGLEAGLMAEYAKAHPKK